MIEGVDSQPKWMSHIAYEQHGLVGVEVKSRQHKTNYPCAAVVQGNEAQETLCEEARHLPTSADIFFPSTPIFAFMTVKGRIATQAPNSAIREMVRGEAGRECGKVLVQG